MAANNKYLGLYVVLFVVFVVVIYSSYNREKYTRKDELIDRGILPKVTEKTNSCGRPKANDASMYSFHKKDYPGDPNYGFITECGGPHSNNTNCSGTLPNGSKAFKVKHHGGKRTDCARVQSERGEITPACAKLQPECWAQTAQDKNVPVSAYVCQSDWSGVDKEENYVACCSNSKSSSNECNPEWCAANHDVCAPKMNKACTGEKWSMYPGCDEYVSLQTQIDQTLGPCPNNPPGREDWNCAQQVIYNAVKDFYTTHKPTDDHPFVSKAIELCGLYPGLCDDILAARSSEIFPDRAYHLFSGDSSAHSIQTYSSGVNILHFGPVGTSTIDQWYLAESKSGTYTITQAGSGRMWATLNAPKDKAALVAANVNKKTPPLSFSYSGGVLKELSTGLNVGLEDSNLILTSGSPVSITIQAVHSGVCSSFNTYDLNPEKWKGRKYDPDGTNLMKTCGCLLDPSKKAGNYVLNPQTGMTVACNTICSFPGTIPIYDPKTKKAAQCDGTSCVMDNITINVMDSSAGAVNLDQYCGQCSDSKPCQCFFSNVKVNAVQSGTIKTQIQNNCEECYEYDSTTFKATKVPCSGNIPMPPVPPLPPTPPPVPPLPPTPPGPPPTPPPVPPLPPTPPMPPVPPLPPTPPPVPPLPPTPPGPTPPTPSPPSPEPWWKKNKRYLIIGGVVLLVLVFLVILLVMISRRDKRKSSLLSAPETQINPEDYLVYNE